MEQYNNIEEMVNKIEVLKKSAIELKDLSKGIPAVDSNVDRILTNIRILEIDITEAANILKN
jgi:hypothetical protein